MVVLPRAVFDPKSSDGQPIFNLNVALIVITSALILVRFYVRGIITKSLGWDDLLAVFAWVSSLLPTSLYLTNLR